MIYINNIKHILDESTTTENKLNERGEAVPYELRVGVELQSRGVRIPVQCPDTAKPPVGVSERGRDRTGREEEETERMEPNSEPHHRCKRWKERQRGWRIKTECVLIEKRAGAKAKETFGIFTANRQQSGTDPVHRGLWF